MNNICEGAIAVDMPDLQSDIKYNCDISDAQFWGYFSICGLLLRYRDLYRSERNMKPWSDIPRQEIAAWIAEKEARWPELEHASLRTLTVNGVSYDPFDASGMNQALADQGLVYGAGYGMYMKPSFFLAERRSVRNLSGLTVFTSGKELVRDLFTSPAMLQEKTVFLRIEPLMILLLYKHGELGSSRSPVLAEAFARYGFQPRQIMDPLFEGRLETAAAAYSETLLLHEVAEATESVPEWKEILSLCAGDRKVELYLRAVKDLVADTSDAGPYRNIIDSQDRGALALTISLNDGYRKVLFPEIRDVYDRFSKSGDWSAVDNVRMEGYRKFLGWRDEIVRLFRSRVNREDFLKSMGTLIATEQSWGKDEDPPS